MIESIKNVIIELAILSLIAIWFVGLTTILKIIWNHVIKNQGGKNRWIKKNLTKN